MKIKTGVFQEIRVKIPEEYYDAIKSVAREEETSINVIINHIIEDFFSDADFIDGDA